VTLAESIAASNCWGNARREIAAKINRGFEPLRECVLSNYLWTALLTLFESWPARHTLDTIGVRHDHGPGEMRCSFEIRRDPISLSPVRSDPWIVP